ncbi:hypothetical protein G9F72_019190 [Clostridium estertheticum]|uniref:hypothetical protein n=1 Tax=Clostridium estertheticum TaxID=238834 RepID=UPI0013E8F88E|nr:hypothetical protein [Clostridium estertheticum]MBZ9688458.1 hypothetical protein [Clostridium estertheticum]
MSKIKELLQIQNSYSAQVDLKKEFNDRILREERMSHYKPIKAHRKAFETIAEGAYAKNSKRSFIISGSYGKGKSHLLLMVANYFESQSDTKEMTEFFKNYSESEENDIEKKAEILKKVRKERRYLVCICDYGTNSFETYVLKAIREALARDEISGQEIDSYYLQAINKINEWKLSSDRFFYDRFESFLENTKDSWTVNKLIQELSEYNKDAIDIFKEIHKKITTSEFEYSKDNYVEIIEQLSKTKLIREKYAGILILFDEFDYQLKGKRFDLDEFQKFSQMCAASFMNSFPVIFVASTHRSFASYNSAYNTEDFLTVNDRIKEIPLETQGIEEIIAAVVNPQKKSLLWENVIKPKSSTFNQISNECTALQIFNWLPAPKIRIRIVENIYPMHPMSTYSLMKLASDVGSNNRSVITFFADEKNDEGSYDCFVRNTEILNNVGELQFYTVDLLFEYFKDKINSDNQELRQTVKECVRNFETSLRELSKNRSTIASPELQDKMFDKVLKIMVIYQIIGVDINDKTLEFGLNMNIQNKEKELGYCLKVACSKKIIYLNDTNHCYEFRRNDAIDISGVIRDYKQVEVNSPKNVMAEIELIIKQSEIKKTNKFFKDEFYLEPVKYNFANKEDKRLIRKFCEVKDIENQNYYKELLSEMDNEKDIKKSYEGIALYVFCETEDDVKKAKILVKSNPSEKIVVGVPIEENSILDDVFSLKAAFSVDRKEFSGQDVGILKEQISYYDANLTNKLKQYITSKNVIYYGENGVELSNGANDEDAAVLKMLESIYESKRNKVNHEDINKSHVFKEGGNAALREAVEILLDFNKPFIQYRKDYAADHGDIRYIQNVLLQHGIIKQIQTVGVQVLCEIEYDTSKYEKIFPALFSMINELKNIQGEIRPQGFIEDYMKTYGIGYNAALLFFALVKRYFKDSLSILPEAHEIGTLKLTSYDSVLDLLYYKKYKNAVMEYKQIEEHEAFFIKELYREFTNESYTVETNITIDQLYDRLMSWYKGLDPVCKNKSLYINNGLNKFIDIFNKIDRVNIRDFILEDIKTIYGYDIQDLILKEKVPEIISNFKKDKEKIEKGYYIIRDKLFTEIKNIFDAKDATYTEINSAIDKWMEGLAESQKSFMNELQNEDSKPLVMHFGKFSDCEKLFMDTLPESYNIGKVKNWSINKTDSYVQKIKSGKTHVEQGLYSVNMPQYKLTGKSVYDASLSDVNKEVTYIGKINLEIIPDSENMKIYITSNGSDPKDINSQREESVNRFKYDTKKDETIRFCGVDNEGKFSKVIKLNLVNKDNIYISKYLPKTGYTIGINALEETEPEIQVTLPKDEESLIKCIRSVIDKVKTNYNLKDAQFIKALKALLNEFKE